MDWFDETTPMGWLVAFWIGCAVLLMTGSWLLTRVYPVKPPPLPPPKKKVIVFGGRPAPR
jgi:hypothetical protein